MVTAAIELALAPALVAVSTLACRRWNVRKGGLTSAFPAIVGPLLVITAQERGAAFAERAANGTLLGLSALAAFVLAYCWLAFHARWWVSVTLAWTCAALLSAFVGWSFGHLDFPAGLVAGVVSLALAAAAMPEVRAEPRVTHSPAPPQDRLAVRMIVTALLVAGLTTLAKLFGPLVGGMLAALPILASVLAVFTHRRDGPEAVVALLRGMLSGMAGFVGFCAVVAVLIIPAGALAAFAGATVVAIGLQALALDGWRLLTRRPFRA